MEGRTGIFGGAFDPVHVGHLACADSFLASGRIDRLLLLPVFSPPHKSGQLTAGFDDRLEMLKLAFSSYGKRVEVSDLESKLPKPSYTVRTIRELEKLSPGQTFLLCMGGDSLAGFTGWYRYREILERVELLVAERPGVDLTEIPDEVRRRVTWVPHNPLEASSTEIRIRIQSTREVALPDEVYQYIRKKKLYRFKPLDGDPETNEGSNR